MNAHIGSSLNVQVNGTPRRKPMNSGGSPSGVSMPPLLATIRIVKTTVCTLILRSWLMFSSGRINSIAAPVVPMKDAITAPIAKTMVLFFGVARMSPFRKSPPETTKSANSSMMNCAYSTSAWPTRAQLRTNPTHKAVGIPSMSATPSTKRQSSHLWAVAGMSGIKAMLNNMMTNGIIAHQGTTASISPLLREKGRPVEMDDAVGWLIVTGVGVPERPEWNRLGEHLAEPEVIHRAPLPACHHPDRRRRVHLLHPLTPAAEQDMSPCVRPHAPLPRSPREPGLPLPNPHHARQRSSYAPGEAPG